MAGWDCVTWAVQTMTGINQGLDAQTISNFAIPKDLNMNGNTSICLELYDADGATEARYYFLDELQAEIELGDASAAGWYDADKFDDDSEWVAANDAVIPYGKGVVIYSSEDDTAITFAGQVQTEPREVDLAGWDCVTWSGNVAPCAKDLKDFAIPADLGMNGNTSICLEFYDNDGATESRYYFLDSLQAEIELGDATAAGWYDADKFDDDSEWVSANSTSIDAGKMFVVYSSEDDTTLTLPSYK